MDASCAPGLLFIERHNTTHVVYIAFSTIHVVFIAIVTHPYLGVTELGEKEESVERKLGWDFILGLCSIAWKQRKPSLHLSLYILS